MSEPKITFHHGEIKEHFVLKNPETDELLLYEDENHITYPVIFFDPAKAEDFRRNNANAANAVVNHILGITFYNNGAVEMN